MLYLFLAQGFEEIEALATVDVLRRANLPVCMVGIGGDLITGAHGISVKCDKTDEQVHPDEEVQAVILPGGMPGTKNLEASDTVLEFLAFAYQNHRILAAICAAPSILGHCQYLNGKEAICFPGFEQELYGATLSDRPVCRCDTIITAKGAGVSIAFGTEIAAQFIGREQADQIRASMQCAI